MGRNFSPRARDTPISRVVIEMSRANFAIPGGTETWQERPYARPESCDCHRRNSSSIRLGIRVLRSSCDQLDYKEPAFDDLGGTLTRTHAPREGIIRDAAAALATARAAQMSMTRRNPKTKAWAMAVWMAEEVCAGSPAGTSRPASRMTLD